MQTILLVLHTVLGLALIAVILLQQGAGATAGAAFGSGASSTVFGARGSASFLTRVTTVLAIVFFSNSFLLAYLAKDRQTAKSVVEQTIDQIPAITEPTPVDDLPVVPMDEALDDLPVIPAE